MSFTGTAAESGKNASVERLARYFPNAVATRIPVQVEVTQAHTFPAVRNLSGNGSEHLPAPEMELTVIEFGTTQEVIFSCRLPLEYEDHILLRNQDGSLHATATVVAVQMTEGRTVVAARFTETVKNWIIQPNANAGKE